MSDNNFQYFLRNFARKHRFSIRNSDEEEVWYTHLSSLQILGILVAVAVVVFVATLLFAANTHLLNAVPGYQGNRHREQMMNEIYRIDSLDRELKQMKVYSDNVALIMEGRTPVIRTSKSNDSLAVDKTLVAPSQADSALRASVERGRYTLSAEQPKQKVQNMAFVKPVNGAMVTSFDTARKQFGVGIEVKAAEQVYAVQDGTVVLDVWSPENGFVIEVQHSENYISVYRNMNQALRHAGDRVKAGESIGALWSENGNKPNTFRFELWYDGQAVDPQKYIVFN